MICTRQNVYLAVISLSYVLKFNVLKYYDHIDHGREQPDHRLHGSQERDDWERSGSQERDDWDGSGSQERDEWEGSGCRAHKLNSPRPAPYSTDYEAIEERKKCNYSIKITTEMARKGTAPRKIRIYATGVWDLFHNGHAECLRQAKEMFPLCEVHLIVGIPNDSLTHPIKGLTVLESKERAEILRHIRYVDEVLFDAPWTFSPEFLRKHKIDFLAHDEEPYSMGSAKGDVYADIKANDMFVATKRTKGISTSDIITSILTRHDEFVKRNLKRGISKADLGVKTVVTD